METRLKEIMQEMGVTSVALAKEMGVSKVTISSLINGKTQSLDTLGRAAEILGVPLWQLFANPSNITSTTTASTITCPKCGEVIHIKTEIV